MKILIVAGFLGAGKTTFIKMLAEKTNHSFVVLENDYGQENIDTALLRSATTLNIYELTEGCVCCTMKQDFATAVLTIANALDPEFLVVEPTGVAKLSNILANIKKIQYERIVLLKPITLLDGNTFDECLQNYSEIYTDQLAAAARIVVTKMEQADSRDRQRLAQEIRSRNINTELILSPYASQPKAWWSSLLADFLDPTQVCQAESTDIMELESVALTEISLASPTHLIAFLEAVVFGVFGRIVRAKGFLPCGGAVLRFDVVSRTYAITGMDSEPAARASCVFIGTNLRRHWLQEVLQCLSDNRSLPDCEQVTELLRP
ncbi:GTP-binding protein [Sporomusa termitida]|uniref:CobW: cobalamin biosynthesis protein CobW n=1 Tax=Sporomusa termitida TaxID=2377 RepID=A0A517DZD1_9FIRM|nr:GTP-binding protein [Sporomusa termitida]QDR82712.1 CobW: cobalamin biosynthesis protein CobW [Sporomusa termitida]